MANNDGNRLDTASRRVSVYNSPSLDVVLTAYEPDLRMLAHEHATHQVSYLLAGELQEEVDSHEQDIYTSARGVKPAGCRHEDLIGPNGALILSIDFDDDTFHAEPLELSWGWHSRTSCGGKGATDTSLLNLLMCGDQTLKSDFAWDLVSASEGESVSRLAPVRPWLRQVREMLSEEPEMCDLASAANDAGVHPVHLSRAFKKTYGLPPSLYRAQVRMACGVREILDGASLADASLSAGFADQSHFTRTLRREMGLSPKRLQRLFA